MTKGKGNSDSVNRQKSNVSKKGVNKKNKIPEYKIELAGTPNSCTIKIQNQRLRALVDSGAEVSLMHRRIYKTLKQKPKLSKKNINLQSVNGKSIYIDGLVNMKFTIGKVECCHSFFVVSGINRNIILGQDWLVNNGVRLYYDLGCLKVKNTYVSLENDIHVSSVVRLASKTVIKP